MFFKLNDREHTKELYIYGMGDHDEYLQYLEKLMVETRKKTRLVYNLTELQNWRFLTVIKQARLLHQYESTIREHISTIIVTKNDEQKIKLEKVIALIPSIFKKNMADFRIISKEVWSSFDHTASLSPPIPF